MSSIQLEQNDEMNQPHDESLGYTYFIFNQFEITIWIINASELPAIFRIIFLSSQIPLLKYRLYRVC